VALTGVRVIGKSLPFFSAREVPLKKIGGFAFSSEKVSLRFAGRCRLLST